MRWPSVTQEEKPESYTDLWDDLDEAPVRGLHVMLSSGRGLLSIALEPGELTIRTRHRYFQPAFSVRALRDLGYVQAGTRTLWLWGGGRP